MSRSFWLTLPLELSFTRPTSFLFLVFLIRCQHQLFYYNIVYAFHYVYFLNFYVYSIINSTVCLCMYFPSYNVSLWLFTIVCLSVCYHLAKNRLQEDQKYFLTLFGFSLHFQNRYISLHVLINHIHVIITSPSYKLYLAYSRIIAICIPSSHQLSSLDHKKVNQSSSTTILESLQIRTLAIRRL